MSGEMQAPATLIPGKAPSVQLDSRYGHFRDGKKSPLAGNRSTFPS